MLMLLDPAALGGLAGLVAVAGWAIGRAHGPLAGAGLPDRGEAARPAHPAPDGAVPDRPLAAPSAPTAILPAPCQQYALEERRAALARPFALAELHAEASAIRRDARILGDVPGADALIVLDRTAPGAHCRFIGLSGTPTCPAATRLACSHGGSCSAQAGPAMPGAYHAMRDPV